MRSTSKESQTCQINHVGATYYESCHANPAPLEDIENQVQPETYSDAKSCLNSYDVTAGSSIN